MPVMPVRRCVDCCSLLSRYNKTDQCSACARLASGRYLGSLPVLSGLSLGRRIAQLRRQRGLTQAQLADFAGVNLYLIRKLEGGTRRTTRLTTLQAIANVLGVPAGLLLNATDVQDPATVAWHGRLADEFSRLLTAGDTQNLAAFLRRVAEDRVVDPWLLLGQFTQRAPVTLGLPQVAPCSADQPTHPRTK